MNVKDQDAILNPYAAPKSNLYHPADDHIEYDGKFLLVTHPAVLPTCCIKCGQACKEKQIHKKLTWTNPWWVLSFFLIGIFYFLVHVLVAKRLSVSYSLCAEHKAKERKKNLIMWSVALISILFIVVGSIFKNQHQSIGSLFLVTGVLVFSVLIFILVFLPRVISIGKVKHNKLVKSKRPYVFLLGGINESFINAIKIKRSHL